MKKHLTHVLAIVSIVCLFTACALTLTACDEHNFSKEYSYDAAMHWRTCEDNGCDEITDYAEHNLQRVEEKYVCDVCKCSFDSIYLVSLTNMGSTTISGVTINLFDDSNQLVASATTNAKGNAPFANLDIANYTAKIDTSTLPKGYYMPEDENEILLTASEMTATVKVPSTLIDEPMPSNHKYEVGDLVHNFSTTSINYTETQKQISLSSYLAKYNAVVLNFWYSGCAPCKQEFPAINDSYINYQDQIAFIAINNGYDDAQGVADFLAICATENKKYVFDFVNDTSMFDYYNAFSVNAFPTTVVIDRYGAVAHIETGSMPSVSVWENLFAYYTADDYQPNYLNQFGGGDNDGNVELEKPDVEMPSSEAIAEVVTNTTANEFTKLDTFTYLPYDGSNAEYSWPWIITQKDGVSCIKTSNSKKYGSFSVLTIEVELKAGQQIFFDYMSSTEADTDILYVQVDTVLQHTISGETAWKNNQLLYVARQDGNYQITFTYQKDYTNNVGDDAVYIKNLRIDQEAAVSGHYDLLYNATTNYTTDAQKAENYPIVPSEDKDYKGYLNHVAYYLNETDGFYHVALSGDANVKSDHDPILYADLYYSTPWNRLSVWNLAYAGAGLFGKNSSNYNDGYYYQALEDYSWIQNNNVAGYAPLNQELKQILEAVVSDPALGRSDNSNDPHHGVDQWLEMCRYFVHYGTVEDDDVCRAHDNTVEALKWRVAKDYGTMDDASLTDYTDEDGNLFEDVFVINVDVYSVHLPRGNYYRFKTTKAGAYLIRSMAPIASDYDVNGLDTLGFVCDEVGNILAENDNYKIEVQAYGKDENGDVQTGVSRYALYDNNFYIYIYLEADTTYHVAGCFNDPYSTGKYDVTIKYLGETASHFTSCATDPAYTYDENDPNFTPIIIPQMGKDRFYLGDDGNYYAQEFDGSQGSPLYIRLIGPTYLTSYTGYTLEQMIENNDVGVTAAEQLYMKDLLIQSRENYLLDENGNKLYGYVVATEKLVDILNKRANGVDTEDSTTYSQTSWLLTAYYYRNIDKLTLQQAQAKYEA